ncbi:MAG TPA: nucleoside 2-deoxyribosyltransferase, partial [Deltaproteobacteria bacterium]|nr:nucleoside 2-deoxyribosyltransferase [Deltaproteobacteria bacterium]
MNRIYCSGPLFCPEEIAGMASIASVLEQEGFSTFLPQRDGLERFLMPLVNTPLNNNFLNIRDSINRAVFALDV